MFFSREALLKSEAHINTGSPTFHFVGREREHQTMWLFASSLSIRASVCGSETGFFSYLLSVVLFVPPI